MYDIEALKKQWNDKSGSKEDFYFWSARYISGKYGEEYQKANREIAEMITELKLTPI